MVHSQHNLIVVCAAISDAGLLCHDRRLGVILPLTITNLMVLGPLMAWWNGQACVCGPMMKAAALIEWIERERIGFCAFVPTIIYDLLEADLDLPAHYLFSPEEWRSDRIGSAALDYWFTAISSRTSPSDWKSR